MNDIFKYNYNVIPIDITNGLSEYEFEYHGEAIYYHTGTATLNIRLNSKGNDQIPLKPKQRITAPFKKIFISCNATAETVTLFIANPSGIKLEGEEVNVDTIQTLAQINNFPLYNSIVFKKVTITDSTTSLLTEAVEKRIFLIIKNLGTSTVYIGFNPSNPDYGYPISPNNELIVNLTNYGGQLRGVCDTGESTVIKLIHFYKT